MPDEQGKTVYYKNFNLFKLEGIDSLKTADKNQSVEVRYNDGIPIYIKFYKPKRTVTLILEDSFKVDQHKIIYVYSTSNFHGGKPGRHKVYTTHTEEYRDIIYVALNDTIICKSYEVPASNNYDYALYLYAFNRDDSIIKHQGGRNSGDDVNLTKDRLYKLWLEYLEKGFIEYKHPHITVTELPE